MIRFSLICEEGHEFDAWFSCGESYDEQTEAGVILCPACGSSEVRKAPMAPAVLRGRGKAPAQRSAPSPTPQESQAEQESGRETGRTYAFLKGLREHLKANADDVGKDFAEQARKMHYGESEERNIYGEATADEAESLHEEGIPALPLPKLPEEHN